MHMDACVYIYINIHIYIYIYIISVYRISARTKHPKFSAMPQRHRYRRHEEKQTDLHAMGVFSVLNGWLEPLHDILKERCHQRPSAEAWTLLRKAQISTYSVNEASADFHG